MITIDKKNYHVRKGYVADIEVTYGSPDIYDFSDFPLLKADGKSQLEDNDGKRLFIRYGNTFSCYIPLPQSPSIKTDNQWTLTAGTKELTSPREIKARLQQSLPPPSPLLPHRDIDNHSALTHLDSHSKY